MDQGDDGADGTVVCPGRRLGSRLLPSVTIAGNVGPRPGTSIRHGLGRRNSLRTCAHPGASAA
jgi:hypothetical protein